VGARLEGIAIDLFERNLAGLAAVRFSGSGGRSLHAWKQGIQPFAEGAAFHV
jgi:hypothetical protein